MDVHSGSSRIPLLLRIGLLASAVVLPSSSAMAEVTRAADARTAQISAASGSIAARLRGVVTSFSGWKNSFFLEDATGGISVDRLENTPLNVGDRIEVKGEVRQGRFAPIVASKEVRMLGHPGLPHARPSAYLDLVGGRFDSQLIRVTGVVQSARIGQVWGRNVLLLDLHMAGGVISVHVLGFDQSSIADLVDSTVEITGVCGTIFNARRQLVGIRLFVSNLSQVKVKEPQKNPASISLTQLGKLSGFGSGTQTDHRIHVAGTLTYQTGAVAYLQEGDDAVRIETALPLQLQPGTRVDAWGFLFSAGYSPVLRNAVLKPAGIQSAIKPISIVAENVIATESGFVQSPYEGLLTEIEGEITERFPGNQRLVWVLHQKGNTFQAQLDGNLPNKLAALESGAHVRLTGICVLDMDHAGNLQGFRILLRSAQDVKVLNAPTWRHSFSVLVALLLFVMAGSLVLWLAHGRGEVFRARDEESAHRHERLQRASGIAGAAAAVIGLFFLGLWVCFGYLPQLPESLYAVTPNGAFGLFVASAAMLTLRSTRAERFHMLAALAVWFVAALGIATLAEYLTGRNLNIDTFLIRSNAAYGQLASEQINSLRAGLASSFCLILASSSIGLGVKRRFVGMSQVLGVVLAFLSLLNLVGRLYGYSIDKGVGANASMPLPSALGFLLLSAAILLAHPDLGAMQNFFVSSPGGLMARRVLPVSIVCPLIIGWLRLQGQTMGFYDTRFGLAIFALCNVITFAFLVWSSAALLNRLERARSSVENSLRDRERKLEMIFDTGSIGDFTWDVEDDMLTAHRSIWKLYGEPNGCGSGPADWFRNRQHPGDVTLISQSLETAFAARRPFDIEFRVIWPDASIHWIACRGTGIFDGNDVLLQVNGLNIDITARKVAEQRLAESETLFRELAEAMPQIVWTAEANGKATYHNRRWFEYTGLQMGEDWRTATQAVIYPDDVDGCVRALETAVREGTPYEYELRIKRAADQSYRWHLARAIPVHNEAGVVERWFGTSTDIDDFKRASNELSVFNESLEQRVRERSFQLAESERRFRQLVENVKDYAIFMLDPEGRIATWNAGAERITGYIADEVIGRYVSMFHLPADLDGGIPEQILVRASEHGQYKFEGWRMRRDGSRFWASVLITAIRNRYYKVTAFSTIIRDMTEQRQAEQLLRSERERAEEANRAKSNFLAVMSHEIRTPMNAILGMADLLWETNLDRAQREYVGRSRRAGTNLLTLINDILDLAKIESGRFDLEQVEFSLTELLNRTIEMMEPKARLKGIELATQVRDGMGDYFIGDPSRLQQVLINLIGNAVKFTEDGEIVLTVESRTEAGTCHILFSLRDTGIGIPQNKLETIFEDFSQAETSTTRRFGGTGLGLGICRRLVERMGGSLTVRSSFGEGSTFFFDVHLEVSQRVGVARPEELMDLSKVRVLVVDDEAVNRLILAEMCSEWGMVVSEADCLWKARELLSGAIANAQPFDLVLLDRFMPDVAGYDAILTIRAIDPRLVVIIASSDNQPGDMTRSMSMGAAAYLLKPIRKAHLLSVLSTTLQRNPEHPSVQPSSDELVSMERLPTSTMKILIAEDSEDNRFLLKAYLSNRPYVISFVTNGREALDSFTQDKFHLVLMDVQMPVMDGLAATTAMRALERQQSRTPTPIVALTANALVEDTERSRTAGCDAHLTKPISKERLISAIESFRVPEQTETRPTEDIDQDLSWEQEFEKQLQQLSQDYLASKRAEIGHMHGLLETRDFERLRNLGHNLKGTAGSFGLDELANRGSILEAAAGKADLASLSRCLMEIEAYLTNSHECTPA